LVWGHWNKVRKFVKKVSGRKQVRRIGTGKGKKTKVQGWKKGGRETARVGKEMETRQGSKTGWLEDRVEGKPKTEKPGGKATGKPKNFVFQPQGLAKRKMEKRATKK